jgi:hypothetical protein
MSTANLPNTTALTQALTSAARPGVLGRIGIWFRKAPDFARNLWQSRGSETSQDSNSSSDFPAVTDGTLFNGDGPQARGPRGTFLRPRARRNSPVEALENGLSTLANLMAGIRVGLETQSRQQENLARSLAHLPELVQQLPESQRLQLEALGALRQQLEQQNAQHGQLADVLERINQADVDKGRALDALCGHEAAISQNLGQVGAVMQSVGANSEAGARVLEQLRDNIEKHDAELGRAIKSQNTRLTALLAIAIALSAVALGAVAVMGFVVIHRIH